MDQTWMNQDYQNPAETAPSADLGYLLFFTAALIFYIAKITFDKTGAKSLKDVACQGPCVTNLQVYAS